jgi:hypothetical protein
MIEIFGNYAPEFLLKNSIKARFLNVSSPFIIHFFSFLEKGSDDHEFGPGGEGSRACLHGQCGPSCDFPKLKPFHCFKYLKPPDW